MKTVPFPASAEDLQGAVRVSVGADKQVTIYYPGDTIPPLDPAPDNPVPNVVTMRQARLALLGAGLLPTVEAAINALPEPDKTQAKIVWEYSGEVQRHFGLVQQMGAQLGMTSEQLDALFITAAAIP